MSQFLDRPDGVNFANAAPLIFCQMSFVPLLTHFTEMVPDFAVVPAFKHWLPGTLDAATLKGNGIRSRLKVRATTLAKFRRMTGEYVVSSRTTSDRVDPSHMPAYS